jgi:hypothetical protein
MKVLLIDIDSIIPNLALKKIEKYHIYKGDEIIWDFPLAKYECDKIYVSCVFDWNKWKCEEWEGIAEIGGSGYSLSINLPKEINDIKPKINFGFTTRGCIRNCYFCIVPQKEGMIHIVGDIYDIWDGISKEVVIMDNNILARPEHFFLIAEQLIKEKLKVDFNQGLDHRLLTPNIAKKLLQLKHINEIRFAFDNINYKGSVLKALQILIDEGMGDWKTRWYVYVGERDTFESVYERLNILKENKQGAYVMRDRKVHDNKQFIALSSWANTIGAFKLGSFSEIFNKSERMRSYIKYIPKHYLKNL